MTVSLVTVVALGACTGDDAKDEDAAPTTTVAEAPSECDGVEMPKADDGSSVEVTSDAVPQGCRNAIFNQRIDESGSAELKKIPAEQRLGFALGVCEFSRSLPEAGNAAPSYAGFVRSTANSWGVSDAVVDEVVSLSGNVCQNDLTPILSLRNETGATLVKVSAAGVGIISVTYTGPNGDEMNTEVASPWEHEVRLPDNTDFRVRVVADEGKAQCTVSGSNRAELAADKPEDAKEATCEVSAEQIRNAAF